MSLRHLCLVATLAGPVWAQLNPADTVFAGLEARTDQLVYESKGGDMTAIAPLMAARDYRGLTHAIALMRGTIWTPDAELATALDFAIGAKLVGSEENLAARATFVLDPPAANGPYRMRLDLLKVDGSQEATVEPGITLGDVHGRHAGELIGVTFVPSKLVQPGLHLVRATLEDAHGAKIYEYYRSFYIIPDLAKRVAALEKTLNLLPDQASPAAMSARQELETIQIARATYYGTGFQNLTGYVFTGMRAAGLGTKEPVDFAAVLDHATKFANALKEGHDPVADARGDLALAYRSTFDGKLVPYRVFVPTTYDPSKKYPLVVLLHGAGGDQTDFMEAYQGLWPKLAEQHGYILASVTGRGPLTGYTKPSGGEQDVLDVMALVKQRYNVDPGHVYLGGHSMGGAGTWTIGMSHASQFAGLIPIAGTSAQVIPFLGTKMPIMIVCGEKDALVAVKGCRDAAAKAKEINAPVKYAEYAGADHLSVAVVSVPDIFVWLDEQTKARR